jgi:hypothetical protein
MIVNTSALVSGGSVEGVSLAVYNGADVDAAEVATAGAEVDVQFVDCEPESSSDGSAGTEKQPFNEDRFWKEVELIGELSRLRSERAEIESDLAAVKAEHAELKDAMSGVKERMSDLEADLKDKTDEFMQVADELCAVASGLVSQLPAKPLAEQTEQASDEGWRAYPAVELLKSMKGGKKKEAIIDLAPTAGDIQDLRIEASKKCMQFAELLPDRCGEKIAQQVEDCLIEFIEKWDKDRNNPQVIIQADELLAEIRAASQQNGWTKEDCQPKETDSPSLRAGFAAFNEGRPHTDVVVDDANAAKQWMIGWVGGEFLSK